MSRCDRDDARGWNAIGLVVFLQQVGQEKRRKKIDADHRIQVDIGFSWYQSRGRLMTLGPKGTPAVPIKAVQDLTILTQDCSY